MPNSVDNMEDEDSQEECPTPGRSQMILEYKDSKRRIRIDKKRLDSKGKKVPKIHPIPGRVLRIGKFVVPLNRDITLPAGLLTSGSNNLKLTIRLVRRPKKEGEEEKQEEMKNEEEMQGEEKQVEEMKKEEEEIKKEDEDMKQQECGAPQEG